MRHDSFSQSQQASFAGVHKTHTPHTHTTLVKLKLSTHEQDSHTTHTHDSHTHTYPQPRPDVLRLSISHELAIGGNCGAAATAFDWHWRLNWPALAAAK